MNKKKLSFRKRRWTALFLSGILGLQSMPYTVLAEEFTDGTKKENYRESETAASFTDADDKEPGTAFEEVSPELFSSQETDTEESEIFTEEKQPEEYVTEQYGVTYKYNSKTDSYKVNSLWNTSGITVSISSEINGKKVTEIGEKLYESLIADGIDEPFHGLGEIRIPDTVTKIGKYAFWISEAIRMEIPDTVTEIGEYAFDLCKNMQFLHFPGGMSVFPASLFRECTSLQKIEIGEGVTEIQNGAMKGCPALRWVSIPASVTKIGEDVFDEGVTPVICGEKGSYAEAYAMKKGLTFVEKESEISMDTPKGKVLQDGVWYTYQEETDSYIAAGYTYEIPKTVVLPEQINGKTVSGIGKEAFKGCNLLERIELPSTITEIGEYAFSECGMLEEIIMKEGIKRISSFAFEGSRNIKSLVLPAGIEEYGEGIFVNSIIEKLTLPLDMTAIGPSFFEEATLKEALVLPNSVQVIEENAFKNSILDTLILPDSLVRIEKEAFYNAYMDDLKIPDSVREIEEEAFYSADIRCVTIGRGITHISRRSFYNSYIEDLILPDTIVSIGEEAFCACYELLRVYLPSSVKNIEKGAFDDCKKAIFYVDKDSYAHKYAVKNNLPYSTENYEEGIVRIDGVCYLYDIEKNCYKVMRGEDSLPEGRLVIREEINGRKVTSINNKAFSGFERITFLELPDTIQSIGASAFWGCSIANEVLELPKALSSIEYGAFYGNHMKEVTVPGTVKEVGQAAFLECTELKEVCFEKGVEKLGLDLFEGCTSLEKVEIPETVYEIEDLGLREGCTVYGLSGSYAENYCKMYQIPFVSTGKTQIQTPKAAANIVAGNTIRAELNKGYTNAEFYDYVLTKDKNFPKTGRYLYRQNSSKESRQDFECLDKGTYYLFVRSGRKTDEDKTEYSSWSEGVKAAVTIQTPKAPKIQKVTVKDNTVAVTVSKVPGTKGYGIVLSKGRTKNGCQKLLKPASIVYASKNNKSVTYIFKDVKRKGKYCVLARTYTKDANNKNIYSRWSGYSKMIQIK